MIEKLKDKGFTLVELLLVLIIVGIILVLAIPGILDSIEDNRTESGKTIERVLKRNLELYNEDHKDDLWVQNDETSCTYVSFSELLSANEDIKLGECLLQSNESLMIVKTKQNKYEYYARIKCGKNVKSIGTTGDEKYIIKDNQGESLYYYTNDRRTCNGEFTLNAHYNGGELVNNNGWEEHDNYVSKIAISGEQYGVLPNVAREGYTLQGWNTNEKGNGNWIEETSKTTQEIYNIYAVWQKDTDATALTFDSQTINVFYSTEAQTRSITSVHGGVGPYTYEKVTGPSDISVSAGGTVTIPAEKSIGEYELQVKVKDRSETNNEKIGTVRVIISEEKATLKCPTIRNYNAAYDGKDHGIIVGNDGFLGNGGRLEYKDGADGTWTTTAPKLRDVGEKTIYVKAVSGDTYYDSQDCESRTITISKKTLTVTATSKSRKYGDPNPSLTYTYSGNITGETPTFTGSLTTSATQASPIGTYDITQGTLALANGTDFIANNYTLSFTKGTLTVAEDDAKCPTTLAGYSGTYDGNSHTITAAGQIGGTLEYRTSATDSWSSTRPTRTDVGTTTVYVRVKGDQNHGDKECGSRDIAITPKTITVTAANKSRSYGEENPPFTYTNSGAVSGQTPAFTGSLTTSATQTSPVGTYDITQGTLALTNGTGFIANNYTLSYVKGTLTINEAEKIATTGSCISNLVYNGSEQTLASGGEHVSYSNNSSETTGTHTVTVSADSDYTFSDGTTSKTLSCTIAKKEITPTANCSNKTYDGNATATCTNDVNGVISGDTVTISATSCAFADKNAGTGKTVTCSGYTLSGTSSENYTLSSTSATTTANITKKSLAVNPDSKSMTFGDNAPAFTVTFDGFVSGDTQANSTTGTLTYTIYDIGGNAVTVGPTTPSGHYSIELSGLSSTNYSISYNNDILTINCDTRITGTVADGETVTYAGQNWTVVGDPSEGNVNLAYNGVSGSGAYSGASTAVQTFLNDNPTTQDALAASCIVNQGTDSGTSTGYTGSTYWVGAPTSTWVPSIYNHVARTSLNQSGTYFAKNADTGRSIDQDSLGMAYYTTNVEVQETYSVGLHGVPNESAFGGNCCADIDCLDSYPCQSITDSGLTIKNKSFTTTTSFDHASKYITKEVYFKSSSSNSCTPSTNRMCFNRRKYQVTDLGNSLINGPTYMTQVERNNVYYCGNTAHQGKRIITRYSDETHFLYANEYTGTGWSGSSYSASNAEQYLYYVDANEPYWTQVYAGSVDVNCSEGTNCSQTSTASGNPRYTVTQHLDTASNCSTVAYYKTAQHETITPAYRPYIQVKNYQ